MRFLSLILCAYCLMASHALAQWGEVTSLTVTPTHPTERSMIDVSVQGLKGDGCQLVNTQVRIVDTQILLETDIRGNPVALCPAVVVPLDFSTSVGALRPGVYQVSVRINGVASGPVQEVTVAAAAPGFHLSPPSGTYTSRQAIDLVLIMETPAAVISGTAFLWGPNQGTAQRTDVSAVLATCLRSESLQQGSSLRCPGMNALLGAGAHTVQITLGLSDGTQVSDTVHWTVLDAQ